MSDFMRLRRVLWRRPRLSTPLLVLLLASFAGPAPASEGPWNVGVWQPIDTSPNSMIVGVAQADDGYLWIAGSVGLTRFDGVKFDQYSLAPLADGSAPRVGALTRGQDGSVIAAIWRGPVVQLKRGRVVRLIDGLPDARPRRIAED